MNPRKRLLVLVPVCIAAAAALWPVNAAAQRRGGGRAIARAVPVRRVPVRAVIVGSRFSYSPFFYPYYYDPFWFGWYDYQFRPYPYPYPPYSSYGYRYEPGADLRIQVKPRQAQVYIDGYMVGTVDNFDGIFQRLRVPDGEHSISVYLDGYRTITEKMLFRPYESYQIKETMQPLPPGEAAEPRPAPTERPPSEAPSQGLGPITRRGAPGRLPGDRPGERTQVPNADRFGSVSVRVQPTDAAVFIDGERWDTPAGENRLLVEVSAGTHRVEIRKEGFKTYTATVNVRAGETVPLNVSLPQEQ